MAAKQANVISHWYRLFENFQTSPLEFYSSVERAVGSRVVPEIHWARIEHKEAGLASANRQYLRMHRGKYAFDICAAGFGKGFFVSWWFSEPPLKFGFLYTLAFLCVLALVVALAYVIGFAVGAAVSGFTAGALLAFCSAFFGVPGLLWVLGNGIRQGAIAGESTLLAMPLVGWAYERIFAPSTWYAMDTALMFQESVHNAVLEVVDCLTAANGIRALTEAERKPILKTFTARA